MLLRADGSELRRLTSDVYKDRGPVWDPAGERLAFYSTRGAKWDYWSIRVDGSDLRQLTALGEVEPGAPWSPDGRSMIVTRGRAASSLWLIDTSRVETRWTARSLPQPVGPNAFRPSAWTRQGDLIAGTVDDRAGNLVALNVLDLTTKAFRKLEVPPAGLGWRAVAGWLPDERHLMARASGGVRSSTPGAASGASSLPPARATISRSAATTACSTSSARSSIRTSG